MTPPRKMTQALQILTKAAWAGQIRRQAPRRSCPQARAKEERASVLYWTVGTLEVGKWSGKLATRICEKYIKRWERATLAPALAKRPERRAAFETLSGLPVERLYSPVDGADLDYERDLANPGDFPYTRGFTRPVTAASPGRRGSSPVSAALKRQCPLQVSVETGNMGLSVAFDLPTLMGYDSDAPEALGEFGKCGVAVNCLRDMEILFDGIPLAQVSTSLTINGPAAVIWSYLIVAAQRRNVPLEQLRGTLQNDILKEYIAQKSTSFRRGPRCGW